MKLSIDSYPFLVEPKIGPLIFLKRLSKCIQNNFNNISILSRYNPNYDIGIFSTLDKSIFKKPFIIRLDGLFIDKLNTKYVSIQENEKIYNSTLKSSGIIFVSEYCKNIYENIFGNLNKPYKIINNGVSLEQFKVEGSNYRNQLKINNKNFVILSSASWRRHKRLNETIKFYKLLKKKIPNLILIILGKNELINKNKDKSIIFAGQVNEEDLSKWYRTANLYLHLAWIEPNSNSQAEAIASGIPTLCANNGGNFELVKKTKSGIISECDDKVKYGLIDYYNPPEPNYEVLEKNFFEIYNNYNFFRKNIIRTNIDIKKSAEEYINFCEKIIKQMK